MISRRDVVTAGVLGSLTGSAATAGASQGGSQDDAQMRAVLTRIEEELDTININARSGLARPRPGRGSDRQNPGAPDDSPALTREVPGVPGDRVRPVLRRLRLARAARAANPDHPHFRPAFRDSVHVHAADRAVGAGRELPRHAVRSRLIKPGCVRCVRVRRVPRGWCSASTPRGARGPRRFLPCRAPAGRKRSARRWSAMGRSRRPARPARRWP